MIRIGLFLLFLSVTAKFGIANDKLGRFNSGIQNDNLLDAICEPSVTTVSGTYAPAEVCAGALIFNDEFDDFNMDLWIHEVTMNGGGNGEFHWYVNDRRNTFVENGKLFIRPTLTTDVIPDLSDCHIVLDPCDTSDGCEHVCSYAYPAPPIQSGLVRSIDTFAFKFGRVEIRAKSPTGDWLWPALWLMPKTSVYGGWPRSGEIDLFESKGNEYLYNSEGQNIGVEEFGSTLHFGNQDWNSAWWSSFFSVHSASGWGFNKQFNLYQMEWTPTSLNFFINGGWHGTIPAGDGFHARGYFDPPNIWENGSIMAPFDQEFYFLINLAVGATNGFFPDEGNANGKAWRNNSPTPKRDFWNGRNQWLPSWKLDVNSGHEASLQVDYVRVWAL